MNKKDIIKISVKIFVLIVLIVSIVCTNMNSFSKSKKKEIGPGIYGDIDEIYNNEQKVDGLIFREISYLYDPNQGSSFNIKIINSTDQVYSLDGFKVIIKDKFGKELTSLELDILVDLVPNDEVSYVFSVEGDLIGIHEYQTEYIPHKLGE